MPDPIGVAIAFSALGANVLATGLLLLFNPRSLEVRWYAAFLTAISLWLLALGVIGLTGEPGGPWRTLYAAAVFVMPGLFMASTLTQVAEARVWARWTAVGATALAVPLGIEVMTGETTAALGLVALGWQVVAWGGASYLQWRSSRSERSRLPERRLAHRLVNGLLVLPGVVVAGAMMLGGEAFFTYVMPLIVFVIHFVIFVGVVRLRFYDIEVRAARSGEIAGRAVEVERLAAVGELAASVSRGSCRPRAPGAGAAEPASQCHRPLAGAWHGPDGGPGRPGGDRRPGLGARRQARGPRPYLRAVPHGGHRWQRARPQRGPAHRPGAGLDRGGRGRS
jgi:hypothetical protein